MKKFLHEKINNDEHINLMNEGGSEKKHNFESGMYFTFSVQWSSRMKQILSTTFGGFQLSYCYIFVTTQSSRRGKSGYWTNLTMVLHVHRTAEINRKQKRMSALLLFDSTRSYWEPKNMFGLLMGKKISNHCPTLVPLNENCCLKCCTIFDLLTYDLFICIT